MSAAKSLTLTNSGNVPLLIAGVQSSSTAFMVSSSCNSVSIAPGGTCIFSVNFAPTAIQSWPATLTVTTAVAGAAQTVTLSGTGTAAFSLPTSYTFTTVIARGSSATGSITLKNLATSSISMGTLQTTGDFQVASTTCAATLSAGQSCTISVSFKPTVVGAESGTLQFSDGAYGNALVSLSGTGK